MNDNSQPSGKKIREVISYADDVFTWVYLDQNDRVIRYEAYVVGYDEHGERTTLDFVLEEGVLDNVHEVPQLWHILQEQSRQHQFAPGPSMYNFTEDGRLVTTTPLKYFYSTLAPAQLESIHTYFGDQEEKLKDERRPRWTRMLRALGYDVIPSL